MQKSRKLLVLFTVLIGLLVMTGTAFADGDNPLQGHIVATSDVVNNDVLMNGDQVTLNGTVNGNAFIVGRNIIINGDVDGSVFAIGENVIVRGTISGSLYVASVSIRLDETAVVGRNLVYVGASMVTERDSEIGQDVYALSLGARLAGTVGRNNNMLVGIYELFKLIMSGIGTVTQGTPVSTIAHVVPVGETDGTLRIVPAGFGLAQDDPVEIDGEEIQPSLARKFIVNTLRAFVSLIIVGALTIWIVPRRLSAWMEMVGKRPFASAGTGLVTYIIGFIAIAIVGVLIVAIGAGLAYGSLWQLAWIWWGLGFSALGISFWTLVLFISFVSKVVVVMVLSHAIIGRFTSKEANPIAVLLLGAFLYVLLAAIPYVGWAISLIVTFFGLGAVVLTIIAPKEQQVVNSK